MAPSQVVVIDTAEMGLASGEIRCIPPEMIADPFFITTHTLPLTFLIQAIQETVPQVELIGIQPEVVAFGYPISESVKKAVQQIYTCLARNECIWEQVRT